MNPTGQEQKNPVNYYEPKDYPYESNGDNG